jgi:hypothetical protein
MATAKPCAMKLVAPLAALLATTTAALSAAAAARPNLMFMMTDQQRWDTMSAVTPSLATPNMDRIAKEGVLFKVRKAPSCRPRSWANFSLFIAVLPQECMGQLASFGPS